MSTPCARPLWQQWQQPSWTQSTSCQNLCLLLADLRKQHPEQPTLATIVARYVAPFVRPSVVLAVSSKSSLHLLEDESSNVLARIPIPTDKKECSGIAFEPISQSLAMQCGGTLHLLNVATGADRKLRPISGPDGNWDRLCRGQVDHDIRCLAFSTCGTCLAAGSGNGKLYFIDPVACAVKRSLLLMEYEHSSDDEEESDPSGQPVLCVAFSPSGAHVVAGLEYPGAICDVEPESERQPQIFEIHSSAFLSLAFSSSGAHVFAGNREGNLIFWETDILLNADTEDEDVDLDTNSFDLDLSRRGPIFSMVFSPRGTRMAIGRSDHTLYLVIPEALIELLKDPQMTIRLEAEGRLNSRIQLKCLELRLSFPPSGRRDNFKNLVFSPSGSRLAAGIGSTVHILDPETGTELQLVQLDADDFIYGCGYLSISSDAGHGQGRQLGTESKSDSLADTVIECVDHSATEQAAVIAPSEAAQMQAELWASGIEARVADAGTSAQQLLLLTFGRHTKELEDALLASSLSCAAARRSPVKPDWASGAKIFVKMDEDELSAMLPRGCLLRPWHVVLREKDEESLIAAIAHLPEPARRFKCVIGRRVLHSADTDSLQGNAEHELNADVPVRHGFVHFSPPDRVKSSHSA